MTFDAFTFHDIKIPLLLPVTNVIAFVGGTLLIKKKQ